MDSYIWRLVPGFPGDLLTQIVKWFFLISKSWCLVIFCHLSCPSFCFCFGFNLKAQRDKVDVYFVTWPGAMEDAPNPLSEAGELISSHLDPELAMGLWVYVSPMYHLRAI